MTRQNILAAADALHRARAERVPIAPVSTTFGVAGAEDAYAVASLNLQRSLAAGARAVGLKVGLTSKAVQQQLGVSQPDFGVLLDNMAYLHGDTLPAGRLMQPKVEAEVAFVVGRELRRERPSWGEFLASLAYALPALEVVDSAIADWKISLVDTVADNASCGVFVLGDQPVALGGISLRDIGMQLSKNGGVVSVGTGAACLGHPLRAAYWLACTMAERGETLAEGAIILSGAPGPMVPVAPGDLVHADLGALGSVACQFEAEARP